MVCIVRKSNELNQKNLFIFLSFSLSRVAVKQLLAITLRQKYARHYDIRFSYFLFFTNLQILIYLEFSSDFTFSLHKKSFLINKVYLYLHFLRVLHANALFDCRNDLYGHLFNNINVNLNENSFQMYYYYCLLI